MAVKIHKALNTQEAILNNKEKLSVGERLSDRHGIDVGEQLRIQNLENNRVGAFTVREIHDDLDVPIRTGQRGRTKTFDTTSPFVGTVSTTVPNTGLTHQQAWRRSHAVETSWHEPRVWKPVRTRSPSNCFRTRQRGGVRCGHSTGLETTLATGSTSPRAGFTRVRIRGWRRWQIQSSAVRSRFTSRTVLRRSGRRPHRPNRSRDRRSRTRECGQRQLGDRP